MERLGCTNTELKEHLSRKDQEIHSILEEKDDILKKAAELEGKVRELDSLQRNDIDSLEMRVESTVDELRLIKQDNSNLLAALSKAESLFTEADSKSVIFSDKYYSKKSEVKALLEKIERMGAEISRLRSDNMKMTKILENRKLQVSIKDNKNKVNYDLLLRRTET